ncbi:MAG: hypothetical protein AAFY82_07160 [Pseudomonadota bacterium]
MTLRTPLFASTLMTLAFLFGACAETAIGAPQEAVTEITPVPKPAQKVVLQSPITTRKPGAAVTFSNEEIAVIDAGQTGSVTLTVNEGYPDGDLRLSASSDPGLSVFGIDREKLVNMADGHSHRWILNYSAETDGVYYIHVFATADRGPGASVSRASAVRVNIGDWQAAKALAEPTSNKTVLANDEPAIIMEAEETIE